MGDSFWIIDTNVLVSAALTAGGTCDQVMRAAVDGKIRLAWSAPMLAEYRAVLSRPKFQFSPEVVSSVLAIFAPADQVMPGKAPPLPDPDDEIFLAAALATPTKVLVTGNATHFPPDVCAPARIFSPTQALQWLAGN
jgi:uncharacterized protein